MEKNCKHAKLPEYIFGFSVLIVLFSFGIFYLIDLRNIFGLRDALFNLNYEYFFFTYYPFFFQHWGRNGGFVEILQWLLLAGSVIMAAFSAGKLHFKNKKFFRFWAILSVAFCLMLLEDAGEIRHVFMSYIQAMAGEIDQGIIGTLAEFVYFLILGFLPLYALIRYWKILACPPYTIQVVLWYPGSERSKNLCHEAFQH